MMGGEKGAALPLAGRSVTGMTQLGAIDICEAGRSDRWQNAMLALEGDGGEWE